VTRSSATAEITRVGGHYAVFSLSTGEPIYTHSHSVISALIIYTLPKIVFNCILVADSVCFDLNLLDVVGSEIEMKGLCIAIATLSNDVIRTLKRLSCEMINFIHQKVEKKTHKLN